MIKYILLFLTFFVLWSCSVQNNNRLDSSMPNEPGKCYAKCMMPDQHKLLGVDSFAVYTGNDISSVELDSIVEYQAASTEWVKKKADRNCLSADPDDCLVWCLVETPEYRNVFYFLKDHTQTTTFKWVLRERKELAKNGGYTEWKEVVCEPNSLIYTQVQNALNERGYDTGKPFKAKMHTKLKGGLTKYQRDNGLPIGNLNIETLESLNVTH